MVTGLVEEKVQLRSLQRDVCRVAVRMVPHTMRVVEHVDTLIRYHEEQIEKLRVLRVLLIHEGEPQGEQTAAQGEGTYGEQTEGSQLGTDPHDSGA